MKPIKLASVYQDGRWLPRFGSYDHEEIKNLKVIEQVREKISELQEIKTGIKWLANEPISD